MAMPSNRQLHNCNTHNDLRRMPTKVPNVLPAFDYAALCWGVGRSIYGLGWAPSPATAFLSVARTLCFSPVLPLHRLPFVRHILR